MYFSLNYYKIPYEFKPHFTEGQVKQMCPRSHNYHLTKIQIQIDHKETVRYMLKSLCISQYCPNYKWDNQILYAAWCEAVVHETSLAKANQTFMGLSL